MSVLKQTVMNLDSLVQLIAPYAAAWGPFVMGLVGIIGTLHGLTVLKAARDLRRWGLTVHHRIRGAASAVVQIVLCLAIIFAAWALHDVDGMTSLFSAETVLLVLDQVRSLIDLAANFVRGY